MAQGSLATSVQRLSSGLRVNSAKDDAAGLAIADRMNITVLGRHTALGDAMVTAEVFLRMIPLLAEMGIHTLGQAREAAQKTHFARLKY